MNSIEHLSVSCLICPALLFRSKKGDYNSDDYVIIDKKGDYNSSDSHHQLYPLFWCNNKEYSEDEFRCGACRCKSIGTTYYFCNECKVCYHKECVESPPLIKSLYHPKHNLQLFMFNGADVDRILPCCYCGSGLSGLFYRCSLCNFSIDLVCARNPSFLINYKKRHEHTLNYFPRKANLICDVCGLDDNKSIIYVCLQCDFVVHRSCIYLPFVIRISRHEHRISFTYSSSSSIILSCGVCRQNVDENCGKYSCIKDCTYVVHSKCATRRDVWDREELEDKPEEVFEHLNSFEVIGDGIIQHFSHPQHHMRYEKGNDMPYDEKNKCQACVLPLYDGDVYKCMDPKCDFILHEACANLPRRKQHMAYPDPLTLQISDTANYFLCDMCWRPSCGFKYAGSKWSKMLGLDVRCAAISEPFDKGCHMHPLFFNMFDTVNMLEISQTCSMCRWKGGRNLNCLECYFVSCFSCATLPYKVRYEHDEHFLTLSYEENASLNWCEVCEKRIDSPELLYTCNECGVALHIHCFRGQEGSYMKPAQNISCFRGRKAVPNIGYMKPAQNGWIFYLEKVNIVPNYGLTRPICDGCGRHCQDKIKFETHDGKIYCSFWEVPYYS